MLSSTQANYLDKDMLIKGVQEWIVKESPIIGMLPEKTVTGNNYLYNVETVLPTVSWLASGDQIVENTGQIAQRTTGLYTMIGDADTDKTKIATNSTQDPEAVDVRMKSKAMAHEFEDVFIRGQTSTKSSTKQFKGLLRMLAELESATTTDLDGSTDPGAGNNTQVINVSATSGALTIAYMDCLVDAIKPGSPGLLLMSRRTRRKLNALQKASGGGITMIDIKEFGLHVPSYDGIPIYVSDFIPDNLPDAVANVLTIATWNPDTTRASTVDNSVIFALKLGEEEVTGLQSGAMTHERETFIEDKNAIRNRFTWICGAACHRKYGLAALCNINPDS